MRLPENSSMGKTAPFAPLLMKEIRDLFAGRALWVLLLFLSPLVGYSFIQAVSLYSEASKSAAKFPALAAGLAPFDGIVVPTFGALYLAATLFFPFIAIRTLGAEKQNGALKLLTQTPYRIGIILLAKFSALFLAWLLALIPCLSAMLIWLGLGGYLGAGETLNLLLGYFLYITVISAIALFAAAITESSATAAIVALSFTIGFWVLDFAAAQGGFAQTVASISLTAVLRAFEQGIFSLSILAGTLIAAFGLFAAAGVWIPYGVTVSKKLGLSAIVIAVTAVLMFAAAQLHIYADMTNDRRNSFPSADETILSRLDRQLSIMVNLAPEDPRFMDYDRNILGKLKRSAPDVKVFVTAGSAALVGGSDADYGIITYMYDGRKSTSRSTAPEEVLPLVYELAGVRPPADEQDIEHSGHPLVANAKMSGVWFYAVLPMLIIIVFITRKKLQHYRRITNE